MNRKISGFAPGVADQLLRYDWPGNVRELENAMERAVALAPQSRVELEDLPEEIRYATAKSVTTTGAVRPLEDIEKDYILAALATNGGNQTHTAEQLQIGAATLYRKLKAYGMIGGDRTQPRKGQAAFEPSEAVTEKG
jgi:DNA-binding NtrC family response regulator